MEYLGDRLRHEMKYYINMSVYHTLRSRLRTILTPDPHMKDEDGYIISSLYFDDIYHSALYEKQSGIRFRKKYRIRSYNFNDELINLECKQKYDSYIAKIGAPLTRYEYDSLLSGNYDFLAVRDERVCREMYAYHHSRLLKPVVTVEYLREAYVLPQGNVRITFDKDIRASIGNYDMFSSEYVTRKVLDDNIMVLEIKFDEFIPAHVLQILKTGMTEKCAISKYVMCREEKRRMQQL